MRRWLSLRYPQQRGSLLDLHQAVVSTRLLRVCAGSGLRNPSKSLPALHFHDTSDCDVVTGGRLHARRAGLPSVFAVGHAVT